MTIDDLALTLHPELGCRTAIHLLECFGSAEAVFAASAGELVRRAELKPALARQSVPPRVPSGGRTGAGVLRTQPHPARCGRR